MNEDYLMKLVVEYNFIYYLEIHDNIGKIFDFLILGTPDQSHHSLEGNGPVRVGVELREAILQSEH